MTLLDRLLAVDRRIIFLFVGLSVALPIFLPLGLPVSSSSETRSAFEFIDNLKEGDVVWISFDYGPSTAPENDPMTEAIMRHCFHKKLRVVVCALYPLGGLGLANTSVARVTREFDVVNGVDYVNLGYKDGAEAVMRKLGTSIADAFPADVNGRPVTEIPLMHDIKTIRDVKVVFTAATGLIGEWWITLVNAQSGTPVIIGPTAVSAPKFYAFINSGQLVGMLGGMRGAAEYEQLLIQNHEEFAKIYRETKLFTGTKGMDAQTLIHAIIIAFIVMGNAAFFMARSRRQGA